MNGTPRHLIDLLGVDREFVLDVFDRAESLRALRGTPRAPRPLAGSRGSGKRSRPKMGQFEISNLR